MTNIYILINILIIFIGIREGVERKKVNNNIGDNELFFEDLRKN